LNAAIVYEQIGDRRQAVSLLSTAIRYGYPAKLVEGVPGLEKVRADEEFRRVMAATVESSQIS
jgi:hypothetical protein